VAGKFLEGDRGQRQFVGDERVVRRERCREKTLARESMRLGNAGYCDAECDERRTVNGCRLQLLPPVTIECADGRTATTRSVTTLTTTGATIATASVGSTHRDRCFRTSHSGQSWSTGCVGLPGTDEASKRPSSSARAWSPFRC